MSRQKTALVTGSSNGIGEAVVKKLAELDYKLIVTGRDEEDIKRVARECAGLSPSKLKPLEIKADLALEQDVDELYRKSIEFFEGQLDLLVNNAGLNWPVGLAEAEKCYEAFKVVMQVNLNSSVRLTMLAAEALRKTASNLEPGDHSTTSVIFIGSIAAQRPTEGLAAYSTSKAAMSMFARCIASEVGPSIRVNSILPGPVATKIFERAGASLDMFREACRRKTVLERIGMPEEIAEAVAFLADAKKTGYITGAELVIDGGCLMKPIYWSE